MSDSGATDSASTASTIDAFPETFRVSSAAEIPDGLALGLTAGYGSFEDVLQLEDSPGSYTATATANGFLAKSTSFALEVPGPVGILGLDLRVSKPGKE